MSVSEELLKDFIDDSEDKLFQIDESLTLLSSNYDDIEPVDKIFRNTHSIKGNSAFLGLEHIKQLCHSVEDVLKHIRSSNMAVNGEVVDNLQMIYDVFNNMISDLKNQHDKIPDYSYDEIIQKLLSLKKSDLEKTKSDESKLRILVAGDEEHSTIISKLLKKCCQIDIARSDDEAIKKYLLSFEIHAEYDSIFIETNLPQNGGIEVCKEIRAHESKNNIKEDVKIFLIGSDDYKKEMMKAIFKNYCSSCIKKPLKSINVMESISEYFSINYK